MQALKLPGMILPCEVIEGTQRDAIIYACGVNSAHGIQRTNPDKQNAVRTMLTNPLVMINLETGRPWNDNELSPAVHRQQSEWWRSIGPIWRTCAKAAAKAPPKTRNYL